MVQKKCKHGFNTGNTLRSAALRTITHKSSVTVTVKRLEYAKSEIEDELEKHIGRNDSAQKLNYLAVLFNTVNTLDYLPNMDVEFSLDKRRHWEIMANLEREHLPSLLSAMRTVEGADVFPSDLDYRISHKGKTVQHLSSSCRRDYFKSTWRNSTMGQHGIQHNQHSRGIQRKGHLRRANFSSEIYTHKRDQQEETVQPLPRDNSVRYEDYADVDSMRGIPLSVSLDVSRDDLVMSKQCATYKPLQECTFRNIRKDQTETYFGRHYGMLSTSRGVHLISQETFKEIKATRERNIFVSIWNDSRYGSSHLHTEETPVKHGGIQRKHPFDVREETVDSSEGSLQQHDVGAKFVCGDCPPLNGSVAKVIKYFDHEKKPPIEESSEQFCSNKQQDVTYKSKKMQSGNENFQENLALSPKPLEKSGISELEKIKSSSKLSQATNLEKRNGKRMQENTVLKELHDENVLTDDKKSMNRDETALQSYHITDKKPKNISEISLWTAISSFFAAPGHAGLVEFMCCTDGMCSQHHDNGSTKLASMAEVPLKGHATEQNMCTKVNNSSKSKVTMIRNKTKKKNLRMKDKSEGLLENNDVLLCGGLLVKIKLSQLQSHHLQQKYGVRFKESRSSPKKYWIDVSEMVSEIRKHRNGYKSNEFTNSQLLFRNIHAVLLMEETRISTSSLELDANSETDSLSYQTVIVHLKSDFSFEGRRELHQRMHMKIKDHLLYSVSKLIEYFVEVYKVMVLEGFSCVDPAVVITSNQMLLSLKTYDWLQSLRNWQYEIHSAEATYKIFKNQIQLANIESSFGTKLSPPNSRSGSIENSSTSVQTDLTSTQRMTYVLCKICYNMIITEADFNMLNKDFDTHFKLREADCRRWTVRYTLVPGCGHPICDECLHQHAVNHINKIRSAQITCPVADCDVPLEPIVIMSYVSLNKYCQFLQQTLNGVVSSHPQWQWCPGRKCNRAVKVNGSALLDLSLVIDCDCQYAWCFSCKSEAHWPAKCTDAKIYQERRQTVISHDRCHECIMNVRVCSKCKAKKTVEKPNNISKPSQDTTVHMEDNCQCELLFCFLCLYHPDYYLQVKKDREDQISVDNIHQPLSDCHSILVPVLFFRQAVSHYINKKKWNPVLAETKIAQLMRSIMKSRKKRKVQMSGPYGANLHHNSLPFLPSVGTEKLFLILVYQFIYEVHVFLEYLCVSLMNLKPFALITKAAAINDATKLSDIAQEIDEVISRITYSPSSSMTRLKHLMKAGKSLMCSLANKM